MDTAIATAIMSTPQPRNGLIAKRCALMGNTGLLEAGRSRGIFRAFHHYSKLPREAEATVPR